MEEYDPETCWTAGELRALGMVLDEGVPDCAWLPVDALVFDRASAKIDPEGNVTVGVFFTLRQPMRYVQLVISLPEAVDVAESPKS